MALAEDLRRKLGGVRYAGLWMPRSEEQARRYILNDPDLIDVYKLTTDPARPVCAVQVSPALPAASHPQWSMGGLDRGVARRCHVHSTAEVVSP